MKEREDWTEIIEAKSSFDFDLGELFRHRDLLFLFVKRDFAATYKQTVLGPAWFFIQPLLTTIVFTIIFGKIAGISTEGYPKIIFYLSGIVLWSYFAECLTRTSTVFKDNESILGKVYFPRIIMPLSIVASSLVKFGIQFLLFLIIWTYYFFKANTIHPSAYLLISPFLILLMGALGLGAGLIISALTTRYRDLVFVITFGVQLLMFITPVIYPLSAANSNFKLLIYLNPITPIIETFRYVFIGAGNMNLLNLGYSLLVTLLILILGIFLFNRVEKNFMDSI
ncbi:MAG: ABC transporter permease [Sporocytophaga sp.]|nr:ABC transporter permease [Sporocytophaga sp.]